MDPKQLEDRRGTAEREADSVKRDLPRITLLNEPLRHHEGDGSLSAEGARERDEEGQVGEKLSSDARADRRDP